MPALSFRSKLLVAMVALVVGVTGTTLFVTQQRVQATYQRFFEQQFKSQLDAFLTLQEARLSTIAGRCRQFARSNVRLRALMLRVNAAVEGNEPDDLAAATGILYENAEDELREVLSEPLTNQVSLRAAFFRFLDARGEVINPPRGVDAGLKQAAARERLKQKLNQLVRNLAGETEQQLGYLAATSAAGRPWLLEVVFTQIVDERTDEHLGALVLGFPVPESTPGRARGAPGAGLVRSGIWLENLFHAPSVPEPAGAMIAEMIGSLTGVTKNKESFAAKQAAGDFTLVQDGEPHRVFFEALNPKSRFSPAFQVCLYPLRESLRERRDLRWRILSFGGLGLTGALVIGFFLSHGLSVPIRELVAGTGEIQRGNFAVKVRVRSRDEIGQLTASFNEMADGLAQRERYRNILNMVADEKIAQQLISGEVTLGGERRVVSVLFCDIRGFTALTQNMPPEEVIEMLNEHMTVLTRVVKEHNGVVDKFVGDLIMAIFGAPVSHGQDALAAARCALDMIAEREKLSQTSRHKIRMGIGVATGEAVAGCMGSVDRLNYTVLGERVNLASRLCSKAGPMQVVIDQTTRERLGDGAQVEPLPPLQLKGFSEPVPAYHLTQLRLLAVNA